MVPQDAQALTKSADGNKKFAVFIPLVLPLKPTFQHLQLPDGGGPLLLHLQTQR